MSWPGYDPYYNYNTAEANTRRTYYGVSGIPDGAVDGVSLYPGSPGGWNAINSASTVAPTVAIDVTGNFNENTLQGFISVGVTPEGSTTGNATLQVALIEDGLYYMGTNGQPYHEHTMRDMIPDGNGTAITLTTGSTSVREFDFSVPAPIVLENAKLVIFVQNPANKHIHNAYMVPVLGILDDCLNETGDIIDFGAINVQDLVKMVGIIIGTDTGSDYCQLAAADMNLDGYVNVQDIVLLVEYIIG